ncbi:MAG: signal peptidase II [Deltaproteobacteria bacterium]|nr:signal peptidase II [Deltaproteobacteria bacterium]
MSITSQNKLCVFASLRAKLVLLIFVVILVVVLDQWSKMLVLQQLSPVYPKKIIDGFFSLTLVMNSGVAFGVFSGIESSLKAYFLLALSGVTVALVIVYYFYEKSLQTLSRLGLALVVGGAFGNMIDRWRYEKVVDFLDFYWQNYHWPAFNIADCAISIGVTLLLIDVLFSIRREN